MRPATILHLRDTYEVGGPGKTILETYLAIDRSRFQLHLGVFLRRGEREDSPFVAEAKRVGMPVHYIYGFHQYDPLMIVRLNRIIRDERIDIVHAHEVKSDVIAYLASRAQPVPIVTTMHGWIANNLKGKALVALDKRIARGFDVVIAVSRRMEQELLEAGVPRKKLRLLHNAIVVEKYRRTGTRGVLQEIVGRQVEQPVVASIGRLSQEKGHADLIEAVALVRKAGHKVSLVLVGDGPERPNLLQQIQKLGLEGVVHLLGYIQAPQRLLEEIDLMVLPSHTEGLPNAALEALLMEVPVLATRVGGTPEIITDGINGRLVSPHSPHELASGILEFLSSPHLWRQMAVKGKEKVSTEFNFRARTQKLEGIYKELLSESD
ncbi:MAG: glycosyltransferase [Nitrospira sp.]|nr:glycosyltransferase [Nitrospira sp.]